MPYTDMDDSTSRTVGSKGVDSPTLPVVLHVGCGPNRSALPSAVDAVFSSHNVEHLFVHEVALAFKEFARVLTPDGYAVVGVPDLQRVAQLIADDKVLDPAYESPAGPIAPIDMVYAHRGYLARGHVFMAHKTGFTARSLGQTLVDSGFARAEITRRDFDLWAVAYKSP